ncbi:hypothetical protein L596_022853 [Steinernema carpocapsae]|uniref:Uncharacterized protein n=1 Tax=Steinernema carpocapsae TaxID=34508 RepID=A0A4U5MMY8_STECR|nr:hypothetical protein L596_022853 [Steinernema carpocapsae]
MHSSFIALFLLISFSASSIGSLQNITVKGQVICNMHTVPNARVDLREHDSFSFDDSLKVIHTDKDGKFEVFGTHDEITTISPYLRILHNCDVPKQSGKHKCLRQTDLEIPKSKVGTVFDMNFINMDIKGHKEKVICDF